MKLVVAAGGTGGHLYPAVAVAREFLRRDPAMQVLFVGTSRGIESKVLAHEGFELICIAARPVMGKRALETVKAVASLPLSLWQALGILRRMRPDLVLGLGGYTSPAVLVAAWLLRIPRVILEPNATPGLANIVTGRFADRVFLAFESAAHAFHRDKIRVVGTPVRQAFLDPTSAEPEPRTASTVRHLLVFGGSQGARAINNAMIEALPHMHEIKESLHITHQTGEVDHPRVEAAYRAAGFHATVVPFLYDMPAALRAADLVVSRSGAMTIAELAVCGRAAILIPLPTAIYNHQMRNAEVMASAGAAVVLPQADLTGTTLARTIMHILRDADQLRSMSRKSFEMRRTDAAEAIVRECYHVMGERHEINRGIGAS